MKEAELARVAPTLSDIAHTLASSDEPQARVLRVVELIRRIVSYDRCAVFPLPSPHGSGSLISIPDLPPAQRRPLEQRLAGYMNLVCDEADRVSHGSEPSLLHNAGSEGSQYHLAVPVAGLSAIAGVLFVERAAAPYDENGLRLLSIVAAQLGAYLTTLRMRQEQIEHARQLGIALHRLQDVDRRKDEFLAMLGHELRNPLGAISTALRLIDSRVPAATIDAQTTKYHQIIDRQLRTLSRIVDDLLDASRVRLGKISLKPERVDLCSIVRRWADAYGGGRIQAYDFQLDVSACPVEVDGDPVRIEQVFSNLMTNAVKFTPPGGRISVVVRTEDGLAVLRVRDSGIGMTPEVLARAFDLFAQGDDAPSASGLGLGLSLVRSLVEKHGGSVDGFSEGPGLGSEFVVRLPLAKANAAHPESSEEALDGAASPLRLLIIEDNDDAREVLTTLVESWGHQTMAASDGLQGLTTALAERPDAAIIDIGLPSIDGFEVARSIRQEVPPDEMTLIAMTGFGQPEDRRRAMDAGFDRYMVKPIDADTLRKHLAMVHPNSHGEASAGVASERFPRIG